MMTYKRFPIELATLGYVAAYLPYVILTRQLSSPGGLWGRSITGLEILPPLLIMGGLFTGLFIWLSGWHRHVHRVGGVPLATKWTAASGACTSLILVTVPLSYTFQDVSIPFMQLLMRGDILIIAPIVDVLSRRKVHWWSWVALGLVAFALVLNVTARPDKLNLPPLAIVTVIVYTIGYFGRLWIMSKTAKDDDPVKLRAFMSEEKIVGFPIALVLLGVVTLFASKQATEVAWGFQDVWASTPHLLAISFLGLLLCVTGVFAGFILLDGKENSYCVPLERSASILAGIVGSVILALWFGGKAVTREEFIGAGLLMAAVTLLWWGPHNARQRAARQAGAAENKREAAAESPS